MLISTVLIIMPGRLSFRCAAILPSGWIKHDGYGDFGPLVLCHAYPKIVGRRVALHCLSHDVRMDIDAAAGIVKRLKNALYAEFFELRGTSQENAGQSRSSSEHLTPLRSNVTNRLPGV